jgi:hypothetical protein
MDILNLIAKSLLEHGSIGLLALAGWTLAGWFLHKDIKKKDAVHKDIKSKDQEIITAKDKLADTIKEISDKRLEDTKELIEDYNKLATSQIQTLDRLTAALEIKNQINRGNDGRDNG